MAPVAVARTAGPGPVPVIGTGPAIEAKPTVVTSLGSGALSGALISIAATPNGASVGDLVVVAFGWASSSIALSTVTDTSSNTWTVVSVPAAANEVGGYAYTIVTTGWASGANTVTGTLASGAPGGRVWAAAAIQAVYSPVVDQHVESAVVSAQPTVATGTLAQAAETCILVEVMRTSNTIPKFLWGNGFIGVASAVGSGTTSSGVGISAWDNLTGTTAPVVGTASSEAPGNSSIGLGILAVKYTPIGAGANTDLGVLTVAGAGNIAISSTQQGFDAGVFTIPGTGNIVVSSSQQGFAAGALTIPGTGNIVISSSTKGLDAGALTIPGAGNILLGSNIISAKDLGSLAVAGAGNIVIAGSTLGQAVGALPIAGAGNIVISAVNQNIAVGALPLSGAGNLVISGVTLGQVIGAMTIPGVGVVTVVDMTVTHGGASIDLGALALQGAGLILITDPNAPRIVHIGAFDRDPFFVRFVR